MPAWTVNIDASLPTLFLERTLKSLRDLSDLHERIIIQLQGYVFRQWPKAPKLSALTLATRRRGGSAVLQDTGFLRLSIAGRSPFSELSKETGTLNRAEPSEAVIGSDLPYAAIHNFGGTIVPVRAKNLAIPATPKARKLGSPRKMKGLTFLPSKKPGTTGVLLQMSKKRRKKGEKPEGTVQYILRKSVNIPVRRFLPKPAEAGKIAFGVAMDYLEELAGGAE